MDKYIQCCVCRNDFIWSSGEQLFYNKKGFQEPKKCRTCRENEKRGAIAQKYIGELEGDELRWAESLLGKQTVSRDAELPSLRKGKLAHVKKNRLEEEAYCEGEEAKKKAVIEAKEWKVILFIWIALGVVVFPFFIETKFVVVFAVLYVILLITIVINSIPPSADEVWVNHGKKAGAEGEDVVVDTLGDLGGNFLIFNQIEIPYAKSKNGFVELDIIVLHECGVHIFEVKNHRGIIKGKESDKLVEHIKVSNSGYVYCNEITNPLLQLNFQVKVLKSFLKNNGINILVDGHVIFSNKNCELEFESRRSIKTLTEVDMLLFPKDLIISSETKKKMEELLSNY